MSAGQAIQISLGLCLDAFNQNFKFYSSKVLIEMKFLEFRLAYDLPSNTKP